MVSSCVPLRSRSNYSLRTGTTAVEDLVERAVALGYDALALTDRNGIYGAIPFADAARRCGLRPIVGAEIVHASGSAVLLPRDRDGFASLACIVTARHLDPGFDLADALRRHARGLHVVVDEAALAARLRDAFSRDSLWIEATPRACARFRAAEGARQRAELEEAARLDVAPVASGRASFLRPSDHELHEVLVAVREQGMVGSIPLTALAHPDDFLRSPAEMERLLAARPEALTNTRRIADECRVELRSPRPLLPRAPLPPGRDEAEALRERSLEGARRRYPEAWEGRSREARALRRRVLERLGRELEVIARLGFTGYFLIVGDVARFARGAGIPVVGRGSGASSLVAYVLDVTSIDPIRHQLLFERFLNERRPDCPDLDLDFCWRRRDEVIEHVYETYGRDRVAMISTHVTYGPRGAFRDAARAFGIPLEEVNRLARRLPRAIPDGPEGPSPALLAPLLVRALGEEIPVRNAPWPRVLETTVAVQGFPRHLGVHCGGIVIGDRPLRELVALEEAAKGIVVTQYEMRAIEAAGLVKIDLLGNRALSEVADTVRAVTEAVGAPPDLERLPERDPETARLLARAETLGCFQIDSPGMRNLLRQLRTSDMAGTIDAHSLIRPGPASSGMKEMFVRAARGGEPVPDLPHGELRRVLAATGGVMLYEEDVMRVAAWLVGGDLAEGDEIRRAIQGARGPALGEVGDYLIGRALARGVTAQVAEAVWAMLRRFASYSFCKAHAAGYGVLAYQTAWLKAHHPAAFAVAVLNNHQGMYPMWVHLSDALRQGLRARPPCVNRSAEGWTLEDGELRAGLARVKGLSERVRESILAEREHAPFESLADLRARVLLTVSEAESLALVGAFDFTGRTRPELVWELRTRRGPAGRSLRTAGAGVLSLVPAAPLARPAPALPDLDAEDRLRHEWEWLDLWLELHPATTRHARALASGAVSSARVEELAGRPLTLVGLPAARRRVRTKRGEEMLFLTLEDAEGLVECTLFPPAYRRMRRAAHRDGLLRVHGRPEDQHGAVTVNVTAVEAFPLLPAPRRARRAGAA